MGWRRLLSKTPEILIEKFLESKAAGSFQVNLKAGAYEIICGAPSDTRAAVTSGDRDKFKSSMASLSEDLAQTSGSFGLEVAE